jgi:hypothetical protein
VEKPNYLFRETPHNIFIPSDQTPLRNLAQIHHELDVQFRPDTSAGAFGWRNQCGRLQDAENRSTRRITPAPHILDYTYNADEEMY